jgi:hypothetical protein
MDWDRVRRERMLKRPAKPDNDQLAIDWYQQFTNRMTSSERERWSATHPDEQQRRSAEIATKHASRSAFCRSVLAQAREGRRITPKQAEVLRKIDR